MTFKQRHFIASYVRTKNATVSAKEAGYSEKTAYSIGSELLKNPEITKAVEDGIMEERCRYMLTLEDYTHQTYINWKEAKHPSVKKGYWEILGNVLGHAKRDKIQQTVVLPSSTDSDKVLDDVFKRKSIPSVEIAV